MKGNPGVITFNVAGRDPLYAFVRGDDGGLYHCYWNADPAVTSWQWVNLNHPPQARVNSTPSVIISTPSLNAGVEFLHVFVRGNGGPMKAFLKATKCKGE
jgi:hypothetical protein